MSGNIIVSILQVKKLRPRVVKQLVQSLAALGGASGSEAQWYDSRAMLLTTGLHDLWVMGLSSLCLAQLYTLELSKCQLSTFPGSNTARCGSLMPSLNNNSQITCVFSICPQGVDLTQTGSVFGDLV